MQMRMVPIHPLGMMFRYIKFITIAFIRFDCNRGCVGIVRIDGIEHVHFHIETVEMEIGAIKGVGHIRQIHFEFGWVRDAFLVSLVFNVFAWILEHGPIILGGWRKWSDWRGEVVDEFDP